MTLETRIALFLLNELVSAQRANDPETLKRWLCGGVQDLVKPAVEKLLLDWLAPFLTHNLGLSRIEHLSYTALKSLHQDASLPAHHSTACLGLH